MCKKHNMQYAKKRNVPHMVNSEEENIIYDEKWKFI